MFCKSCGKEIPDDSIFCLYCGVPLGAPPSGVKTTEIARKGVSLVVVKSEKAFGWWRFKIRVIVDGEFVRDFRNGGSVSFEVENGKHIIFCEAKLCTRSDPIEITMESNEVQFSAAAAPPSAWDFKYKLALTKTKETERGTWE